MSYISLLLFDVLVELKPDQITSSSMSLWFLLNACIGVPPVCFANSFRLSFSSFDNGFSTLRFLHCMSKTSDTVDFPSIGLDSNPMNEFTCICFIAIRSSAPLLA